ncbi:uncharacterized protein LOC123313567 isoform X2 [Coccinella septempunctata]|uniref:uncharacterized protein LOC123313567 isoform X2 n=1 Tax=Coccinella septempunctata TaxID=41139 RepID=UPI001D06C7F2|nr:uncharacterized protein LOC123313567 isoform X2 [Coccinella septempunctata]
MEKEDEETTISSKTSTQIFMSPYQDIKKTENHPQCQILMHQASGDSQESDSMESSISVSNKMSPKYSLFSKSPHSSSSQEDDEHEMRSYKGKYLLATGSTKAARSMECLRAPNRPFLSSSERDMIKILSESVETKSLENIDNEVILKRYAISGDSSSLLSGSEETISAEKRRGLWSGKARVPQHLSLPPDTGYLNLSPGDRKLTILSPHSPNRLGDLFHISQTTLKTRGKKAIVLPRLVIPKSHSDVSQVSSEQGLES